MESACSCPSTNKDDSNQIITTRKANAVTYQVSPSAAVEEPKQQTLANIIGNLINAIISIQGNHPHFFRELEKNDKDANLQEVQEKEGTYIQKI